MTSVQEIKKWWGKHVNEQPVWLVSDLPGPLFKDILISLKLAYEIRKGIIVLGKPETELAELVHAYFWEILSCILKRYTPYAITGIAAINYHLGNESIPAQIDVLTKSSSSKIDIQGISHVTLEKNANSFLQPNLKYLYQVETKKKYILTLASPENCLVRLRPQHLKDHPQVICGFLKTMDFDIEILGDLLLQKSRPIVYLRLAALFEQVGKIHEATLLRNITKSTIEYAPPGKGQILKYALPQSIASPKRISDENYVTRFRDQLRYYSDRASHAFRNIKLPEWNLKKILAYAEKTKKYDTYHSSTIEGYRVTEDEIQMLIEGNSISSSGKSREEIERKMALKGYLEAHQFILKMIEQNFKQSATLTELIIREIYAHLFSPSVESGLLKKDQLIQYRNDAIYIRSSRYVPPNYKKVDELMRCLVEEINTIHIPATRALMAHYGFVTVHPYFDGNGRVARLLMNYLLCQSGIPWVTIRIEDRDTYFRALEIAQCDENFEPLIKLLEKYFEEQKDVLFDSITS